MTQDRKNSPPLNAGIDLDNPVTCTDCKQSYMCTPFNDYYSATNNDDGHCERCLLVRAGMGGARVVTGVLLKPRQDERPHPMGRAVTVVRSSGTVEKDWEVAAEDDERVTVRKWYPEMGEYLFKQPSKELFNEWQQGGIHPSRVTFCNHRRGEP